MEHIGLYDVGDLLGVIQTTAPAGRDAECTRCSLHNPGLVTRCMPAEGQPGGLLVVTDSPTKADDQHHRPLMGASGVMLRTVLRRHWTGPIALDNAVKCAPGAATIAERHIEACRPFLANTVDLVRPQRIITLGARAMRAVVGRASPAMSIRRGYGWLPGTPAVPVFFLLDPDQVVKNRFLKGWFEADVKWALSANPPLPPWHGVVTVVDEHPTARDAYAMAMGSRWVAFDCETSGKMGNRDFQLLSIAIAFSDTDTVYVWDRAALEDSFLRGFLTSILLDKLVPKVGQNVKYDVEAVYWGFQEWGETVWVTNLGIDTRLVRKLMDSEVTTAKLETLAELVGMGGHKDEAAELNQRTVAEMRKSAELLRKRIASGNHVLSKADEAAIRFGADPLAYAYAFLPRNTLLRYCGRDTLVTAKVARLQEDRMVDEDPASMEAWDKLLVRASAAFAQIEVWGMPVNSTALSQFIAYLKAELQSVNARLSQYDTLFAPASFNPNSHDHVRTVLFQALRLPVQRRTDTGKASTDAETLAALESRHPTVKDISTQRRFTKMLGTYGEGFVPFVRDTGRIHSTYNLDGTITGRLSSDSPNLQNIPRADTPEGKMARNIFQTAPGRVFVEFDYSQIELRIAADLSGDAAMKKIFVDKEDYHQRTAEMVAPQAWGITAAQVTEAHRSAAKTINFRTLYGGSDYSNAKAIGCSEAEAQKLRLAIFGKFTRLAAWIQECLREGRRTGESWTYWEGKRARRRNNYGIGDGDEMARSTAETGTWNTPIQGTASEYCLQSCIAVVEYIRANPTGDWKLVATVHDALMLEVDEDHIDHAVEVVKTIMEGWPTKSGVPITVDVKVGTTWGAMQKYVCL